MEGVYDATPKDPTKYTIDKEISIWKSRYKKAYTLIVCENARTFAFNDNCHICIVTWLVVAFST